MPTVFWVLFVCLFFYKIHHPSSLNHSVWTGDCRADNKKLHLFTVSQSFKGITTYEPITQKKKIIVNEEPDISQKRYLRKKFYRNTKEKNLQENRFHLVEEIPESCWKQKAFELSVAG